MSKEKKQFPVLFVGHGSPLLVLESGGLAGALKKLGKKMKPKAIVGISAHWETNGTLIQSSEENRTIHDFYGFSQIETFLYKNKNSLSLAKEIMNLIPGAQLTKNWGLDHGLWTPLALLFPEGNIPVVPLSMDKKISRLQQYEIGKTLSILRQEEIFILCSGNIVHNLRALDYSGGEYAWAKNFDEFVRSSLVQGDLDSLLQYEKLGTAAALSVPTTEHFNPLFYALGAANGSSAKIIYQDFQMGSVSRQTILFGEPQ